MKFKKTKIENLYLISPELFFDNRGIFRRNFCKNEFKKKKITFDIKQCNVSENFKKEP